MTNWIKYFFFFVAFIAVTILIVFVSTRHQTNIVATQEVQLGLQSVSVGQARESGEGEFDPDALIANLLVNIAESHKSSGQDVRVNYAFLDRSGSEVRSENDAIKSVQFEVEILDKNGEVQSTSRQRIELDEL